MTRAVGLVLVAVSMLAVPRAAAAQYSYRGFVDAGLTWYPREAPNDDTHLVADVQARFEPSIEVRPWLSFAGSFEGRADTHHQVGTGGVYWDRTLRRPAVAVRTVTATLTSGPLSVDVGKQFVRWGTSDIISPTDYLTARDYIITAASEVLAVTAVRVSVTHADDGVEFVYAPRMTPSRMPLLDQRWVGLQASASGLPLQDGPSQFADVPAFALRYHRTGRVEFSGSFFQGPHHLPLLETTVAPPEPSIVISRSYPDTRAFGADLVTTVGGVTIRAEAAWLYARSKDADDYGLWVVQGERQVGEWLLLGGYVGEHEIETRGAMRFAADRGLARSFIARLSRTFDDGRAVSVESLIRQDAEGVYVKAEYSRLVKANWRVTGQFLLLGGSDTDFLGQYRRNSFGSGRARFSF